jgi:glycosyltransferase involved in cell wall biosynthesis
MTSESWHATCFGAEHMLTPANAQNDGNYDVICFSHLRWRFVFQRPQHLLTRCAKTRRVFYVEEPELDDGPARLELTLDSSGVQVVVPHLPARLDDQQLQAEQAKLLLAMCEQQSLVDYVLWFYTPMALPAAARLAPMARVYDCMDELSAFRGAPKELVAREAELLSVVDLVYTGGQALFEHKRHLHGNVHAFPSSVDSAHFSKARHCQPDPPDQAAIRGRRLGFFGVIDERMDLALLQQVARLRPDWQLVLLGPVVKVDPSELPRLPNIHYLGGKSYEELPAYISGWDVALLPFAKNEATRFISPTKTPEYLAAGKPVVSTSIRDVVRPYAVQGLVRIADTPADFVMACDAAMSEPGRGWLRRADAFLAQMSWDRTWAAMEALMDDVALPGKHRSAEHDLSVPPFTRGREVG